jgi:hypothetical protein
MNSPDETLVVRSGSCRPATVAVQPCRNFRFRKIYLPSPAPKKRREALPPLCGLKLQITVENCRAQRLCNVNVVEIELDALRRRSDLKYFSSARA